MSVNITNFKEAMDWRYPDRPPNARQRVSSGSAFAAGHQWTTFEHEALLGLMASQHHNGDPLELATLLNKALNDSDYHSDINTQDDTPTQDAVTGQVLYITGRLLLLPQPLKWLMRAGELETTGRIPQLCDFNLAFRGCVSDVHCSVRSQFPATDSPQAGCVASTGDLPPLGSTTQTLVDSADAGCGWGGGADQTVASSSTVNFQADDMWGGGSSYDTMPSSSIGQAQTIGTPDGNGSRQTSPNHDPRNQHSPIPTANRGVDVLESQKHLTLSDSLESMSTFAFGNSSSQAAANHDRNSANAAAYTAPTEHTPTKTLEPENDIADHGVSATQSHLPTTGAEENGDGWGGE
ncbi:MAG: hypothetical protein M1840_006818 [Geoglossum simile]|nr:MAG: hypothetical protein M1840_006818 [Geoglossum simile]